MPLRFSFCVRLGLAAEDGFQYSSNRVAHWDSINETEFGPSRWASYHKAVDLYSSGPAQTTTLLPRFVKGMVEIPVSIPDDEALVERLRITSTEDKAAIWCDILERTHARGEIFTLSLHPERIHYCEDALEAVLARAKRMSPSVWIAPLKDVASWWQERSEFSLSGTEVSEGRYAIKAKTSSKGTVLVRGAERNGWLKPWHGAYSAAPDQEFEMRSTLKPFVGIQPSASDNLAGFLADEGYIVERSSDSGPYGVYLDALDVPDEAAKKDVVDRIEQSDAPVVRLWRWPEGARSCLAITGDIDSITLVDFFMRQSEGPSKRHRTVLRERIR